MPVLAQIMRMGKALTESLLRGTTQVTSKDKSRKTYTKSGGLEQLEKDFKAYGPRQASRFKTPNGGFGKAGKVGDRILIMKTKGENGKPTMQILKADDVQYSQATGKKFSELHRLEITYTD